MAGTPTSKGVNVYGGQGRLGAFNAQVVYPTTAPALRPKAAVIQRPILASRSMSSAPHGVSPLSREHMHADAYMSGVLPCSQNQDISCRPVHLVAQGYSRAGETAEEGAGNLAPSECSLVLLDVICRGHAGRGF